MSTDIESVFSQTVPAYALGRHSLFHRHPARSRGNGSALGLFAFASSSFIAAMYNLGVRGIMHNHAFIGHYIFCGGVAQILAGMWEFANANTLGATIATLYGAFNLSIAFIIIPSTGIAAAYPDPNELSQAIGVFLLAWTIITFCLLLASLRTSLCSVFMFTVNTASFALLSASCFLPRYVILQRAGGGLGLVVAMTAYYAALAALLRSEKTAFIRLPIGVFEHPHISKSS